MLSKRSSIIIAAIGALFCFLSVAYVSCTKPGSSPLCNGVTCENGGYCLKGNCICPAGYEGINCGTASVDKYIGPWDVNQRIVGSDSINVIGKDSLYTVDLLRTATPTSFFINNFMGNANYNNIICILDTLNTSNFAVDTTRGIYMLFDNVAVRPNSHGTINTGNRTISASVYLRFLNSTHNWEVDTLSLSMTPHH